MSDEASHVPTVKPMARMRLDRYSYKAYMVLLLTGAALLVVGGFMWIIGMAAAGDEYGIDADYLRAAAGATFSDWAGWAMPLLAGAGIVAGLGRREPGDNA